MQLYYTVSSGYDSIQNKPSLSIGGYKSSSIVINDDYSNIFDEISMRSVNINRPQYIALILKNTTNSVANNLKVWMVSPITAQGIITLAAVKPLIDQDGNPYIERVATTFSKPMGVNFTSPTVDSPALIVDSMAAGDEIGIWLCRSIDKNVAMEQYNDVAMIDPNNPNRYIKSEQPTEEIFNLYFSWE